MLGENTYGVINVPILSNPSQVSLGYMRAYALDDTGVVCWGYDNEGSIISLF